MSTVEPMSPTWSANLTSQQSPLNDPQRLSLFRSAENRTISENFAGQKFILRRINNPSDAIESSMACNHMIIRLLSFYFS